VNNLNTVTQFMLCSMRGQRLVYNDKHAAMPSVTEVGGIIDKTY